MKVETRTFSLPSFCHGAEARLSCSNYAEADEAEAEGVFWSNEPVQNEDDTRHSAETSRIIIVLLLLPSPQTSTSSSSVKEELVKILLLQPALGKRGRNYKTRQQERITAFF